MSALSQQQLEAAQEFANATIDELGAGQDVHAGTAIAATARMAGTFLFRSFNFSLDNPTAGQAVLSMEANEQGPQLQEIVRGSLAHIGINVDEEKMDGFEYEKNKPLLDFLETQRRLEPKYTKIKDQFGFSLQEAAQTAAVATAMLIDHSAQLLNPSVAFGIAVYGFIEGTKTVPETIAQ